jgi:uncharacterized protein
MLGPYQNGWFRQPIATEFSLDSLHIRIYIPDMQGKQLLVGRDRLLAQVEQCLSESPVTVLLGARQTGKTTIARIVSGRQDAVHYYDLERPADRAALSTPEQTLTALDGLIVIDEVQRIPELFAILRPLVDRNPCPARFLLLGSASPDLVKGVSESLAGRSLFVPVPGFSLEEVGPKQQSSLWLRGGFPRSYLAGSDAASKRWRDAFVATFLERDIPQLGIRIPSETLRRFWTMLSHFHGQIWNASEFGRSLGTNDKTARRYLDILSSTYVLRVLPPWFANIGKRQRKSPKVYVRDSGLLHALLGLETMDEVRSHPKYGASWEGFALEQVLAHFGERSAYFWATQGGAEIDLLISHSGKRFGFEFKCLDAPRMTKSLGIALSDLELDHAYVVYPGDDGYPLDDRAEALPLGRVHQL